MSAVTIKVDEEPVIDPKTAAEELERVGFDPAAIGNATSYTCPVGREPGAAVLLLQYATLKKLTRTEVKHVLKIGKLEVKSLWFQFAEAVAPGAPEDDANLFRCTFLDGRARLLMRPVDVFSRNMRKPEAPTSFFDDTVNGGTPWTWEEIIEEVWGELDALGAWPGWPEGFTPPDDPPENLQWVGAEYWHILNDLVEQIGLAIRYTPGDAYFLYEPGDDLEAVETILAKSVKIADNYPQWSMKLNVPSRVLVLFPKQESGAPSEITIDPYHGIEAGSDDILTEAGIDPEKLDPDTRATIIDDMTARSDGGGGVENSAELVARAAERARVYYAQFGFTKSTPPRGVRLFSGVIGNISPGGRIERITWWDYGDGWKTQVSMGEVDRPEFKPTVGGVGGGSESIIVQIKTIGNFPTTGQKSYKAERQEVSFTDGENNGVTLSPTGEVVYVGAFRGSILIFNAYYVAVKIDGKYVVDNQSTFLEDLI